MLGLALENETERDDDIAPEVRGHHFSHDRNFERAGRAEKLNYAVRVDLVKFLAGVVDQPLHEVRVVFAGHDGEAGRRNGMQLGRTGREFVRHDAL